MTSPRGHFERAITLFDYEAKQSKELTFRKNELIDVLDKRASGWWIGTKVDDKSQSGLFPSNYVHLIDKVMKAEVLYDFEGKPGTFQLSMKVGDIVSVYVKSASGWWKGELNGKTGVFPETFVKELPEENAKDNGSSADNKATQSTAKSSNNSDKTEKDEASESSSSSTVKPKKSRSRSNSLSKGSSKRTKAKTPRLVSEAVICLYDYEAKRPSELSFNKDDIIVVTRKKESGWWVGSLHGVVGKFPRKLTKLIDKADAHDDSDDEGEPDVPDDALESMFRRLKLAKNDTKLKTSKSAHKAQANELDAALDALNDLDIKPKKETRAEKLARQRKQRNAKLGGRSRKAVAGTRMHSTMSSAPEKRSHRDSGGNIHLSLGRARSNSLSRRVKKSPKRVKTTAAPIVPDVPALPSNGTNSSDTSTSLLSNSNGAAARSQPRGRRALAVYAYTGEGDSAITFQKGEIVTVLRELSSEWWLGRTAGGAQGVFPAAYVRAIVESHKARALYDFEALKPRHLSFQHGDIITVFRKDKQWWDGMCNGRFGSFPGNYVRLLDETEAARLEAGDDSDDETAGKTNSSTTSSAPNGNKARLFHVKGKDQIMVTKTVCSARSLNDGDVFVLDGGTGTIYLWNGTYARQLERTLGAFFAQRLAEEESAELLIMEKGSEQAAFWEALGGRANVLTASEGGDDAEVAKREMKRRKLYRVVDGSDGEAMLEPMNVDSEILSRGLLDAQHTYVLDINEEVFVWAGNESSGSHKFVAMQKAEELLGERPPHVDITWVVDGNERVFFRAQFVGWEVDDAQRAPAADHMNVTQRATYELQLSSTDVSRQDSQTPTDPLKVAVIKFNSKPKDGIKYMVKQKLCRKNAKDVAQFLWDTNNINKASLGDYLSEKEDFNQEVLAEFVQFIDLHDMDFDTALREFLKYFRLPGEAQKIDRIMEVFAAHYLSHNPSSPLVHDTCFVMAFAVIMLNTDAHNPAIKNKMTKEEFVTNNLRIGDDLSPEFLELMYDKIVKNEIKMDVDVFSDQEKSGFLSMKRLTGWKRKWFVLSNNNLYYFADKSDKNPRFILPLEALQVSKLSQLGQKHCLEIYDANAKQLKCCKLSSDGVLIEAKQKSLTLAADSAEHRDMWFDAIRQNVLANPFFAFLKQRLESQLNKK